MARTDDGLRSEALRAALAGALAGNAGPLFALLARHGGAGTGARPNPRLAAATVVEVFADRQARAALGAPAGWLAYLAALMDAIAEAPRAADRSPARRRVLQSLPATLAATVAAGAGAGASDDAARWFEEQC